MAKPDPLLWGNSTPPTPDEIRHATNSARFFLQPQTPRKGNKP